MIGVPTKGVELPVVKNISRNICGMNEEAVFGEVQSKWPLYGFFFLTFIRR